MSHLSHLAIIMDGNGRWARGRGHNRFFGHVRGARVANDLIKAAVNRNIPYLTLYAFSSENWLRPRQEVTFLMRLLGRQLKREQKTLQKFNVRFRVIGDVFRLPKELQFLVNETVELTKNNTGLNLVFALSYGARQELTKAVRKIAERVHKGELDPTEVTESLISSQLESSFIPDPDLIIRTSGETRLSNFMLWQSAYTEFYFTQTLWPDFSEAELDLALHQFASRERRYGRVAYESLNAPIN